ncbi:MAG: TonB-dependent receptor [Acidobacteriota bacterium]
MSSWCTACWLAIAVAVSRPLPGQAQTPGASIAGTTTTQSGTLRLPGVTVTLTTDSSDPSAAAISVGVSDGEGRFEFTLLPAGRYSLRASLAGFAEVRRNGLTLGAGGRLEPTLDLAPAITEHVDAVGARLPVAVTGGAQETIDGRLMDLAPVRGDDFRALLPMLPGVVRGPDGRINMKGGRPTQTGLQLSQAYVSDPSTGDAAFDLPVDAVESVDVMPNPYAAEYGRFSSGLTKVETRKGTATWRATANNFIPVPCLKLCDARNVGVRAFDPRLIVSGPIIKDRLLLSQSIQYHFQKTRVPSLPDGQNDTSASGLVSFTRLDTTVRRSQITGTVAFFPRTVKFANLNTFNPASVTPTFQQRGYNTEVAAATRFSPSTLLETTFNLKQYDATVGGQGAADMVFTPEGTQGNFFNHQVRRTRTLQGVESLRLLWRGVGEHLLKMGVDVLGLSFDGSSESRPVEVRREDGSLAQRIVFGGPTLQRVSTVDSALFVQDTWRWNSRVIVELGARVDRDGVIQRTNLSPRFGTVISLLPDGKAIVRGGVGVFYERTPLLVGAFETIEAPIVTRYDTDGITPRGPAVAFVNRIDSPLRTPAGRVWNIEFDHHVTPAVLLKVSHLERAGRDEMLIEPGESGTAGVLDLASRGRSDYRETEATLRYAGPGDRQLTLTYVHSRSQADLNAFDIFFGNFRNPLVRPNQYSQTSVDAPNRVVALGVFPMRKWIVSPLLEVRNGFPYSIVNEDQDFVGRRNAGTRFPVLYSADLGVSRDIRFKRRNLRIGLKANHLLNNWAPRDVQANTAAPDFGKFYNSIVPRFGLILVIRP